VSNPDSFINEVTEELRRDRAYRLFMRYWWVGALLVALIVGGAAWNEWNKARNRASAQAFGDAVFAALAIEDRDARAAAIAAIDASGGRAAVLQLLIAVEAEDAEDLETALAALQRLERDSSLPQAYRQIAALKRVIIGGPAIPVAERESVLSTLSQPGQALRPLALEQLALLRIEAGEHGAALAVLRGILDEPEVTQGLRLRVTQLIVALGGDAALG